MFVLVTWQCGFQLVLLNDGKVHESVEALPLIVTLVLFICYSAPLICDAFACIDSVCVIEAEYGLYSIYICDNKLSDFVQ